MYDSVNTDGQTIDLGIARQDIEAYLNRAGYWKDAETRERYQYVLSPSAYVVSKQQQSDLARMAACIYGAVSGLNERLCEIAGGAGPKDNTEAALLKLANVASRGLLRPCDGEARIPPIMKVDLIQNAQGRFSIVEIDAYNPRGLGFVALLEGGLPASYLQMRYPGVLGVRNAFGQTCTELCLIVSEFERFYEAPFRIFKEAMGAAGLNVRLVREADLANGSSTTENGTRLLCIPDTMDKHPAVRDDLVARYRSGKIDSFFPPVAYLGSKAFLPFLRECEGMSEFLPKTILVGKRFRNQEESLGQGAPLVLKAAVSSGLKKVLFSDLDPEVFAETFARVRMQKSASWILQEQVEQEAVPIVVFDGNGGRETQEHFLRITAYVSAQGIVDVEITGRPDRKVHGAPDCIQIPAILA